MSVQHQEKNQALSEQPSDTQHGQDTTTSVLDTGDGNHDGGKDAKEENKKTSFKYYLVSL